MSDVMIQVEGLSKRYRIGVARKRASTLREAMARAAGSPFAYLGSRLRKQTNEEILWAIKDVSFEVRRGEVLGVIGRNGAGKSTLLKILSRITDPTVGRALIRGRVNSLLEVGTGFHPELTGRENIFMNAAMHGMRRAEISRKMDEIIAFAEIERFIDTPVKRYSSGMYMRLAFAVAAHLEPDILLIDEVLAVGDTSFQKKCLAKMEDASHEGRTVLFVSHNMSAVTSLCSRTILMEGGRVVKDGPSAEVAAAYLWSGSGTTACREWKTLSEAPGNEFVRLLKVRVRDREGKTTDSIDIREPVAVEMEFAVLQPGKVLVPSYNFMTEEGLYAFFAGDLDPTWRRTPRPVGRYVVTAWIPGNLLAEGSLRVSAAINTMDPFFQHAYERDAVAFQVIDPLTGDTVRGDVSGRLPGVMRPMLKWEDRQVSAEAKGAGV